jgi:hypothetical protein
MTRPDRHRIQRQVIDLALGSAAQGPAVQEALARSFRERALPELEAVFDQAAGPHELLRLDRLEIDLGRITGREWEPQFRKVLVAELTRSLAQFKPVAQAREAGTRSDAPAAAPLEQFLFFLVHGRLPWWGARPGRDWAEARAGAMDASDWDALRRTVLADVRARVRLVHCVGDDFLATAVARWSALEHAARVLEQLAPARMPAAARARWRTGFWGLLLDRVLFGRIHAGRGPQLMSDLLALRRSHFPQEDQRTSGPLIHDACEPAPPAQAGAGHELPQPWHGWLASLAQPEHDEQQAPRERDATDPSNVVPLVRPALQPGARRVEPAPAADGEAIYLEGAGAILLHPFLEELFRGRGLLEGRSFRDTAARDHGVRLLGLLTFGSTEAPEYDLLLAKLLCGCPFEEPLESTPLDEEDAAACDALLHAVVRHWTALRGSSPAWLREQFFLREGKLEAVDSGRRLTVERRAQDVLLARLPWGCGVVEPPWLSERLFVHWMT